jgi:hypothetical protein
MTGRLKGKVVLGVVVLVLVLWAGSVVKTAGRALAKSGDERLRALIRKEAPLPEAQRREENLNAVALAEENRAFRRWFAGLVVRDDIDMKVRWEASEWLFGLESDDAIKDVTEFLLPWFNPVPYSGPAVPGELNLRGSFRTGWFLFKLLGTDLPAEDLLELLERGWPEWRARTEAYVPRKPRALGRTASEAEKKSAVRYEEVLALAQRGDEARFLARIQNDAPLAAGEQVELADLPALADGNPVLRQWMARVVASPVEDHWVRALAFRALLNMKSDEAVKSLMGDLNSWLRAEDPELDRPGRDLRKTVGILMTDRLLLTDVPLEEVMALLWRSLVGRWDIWMGTEEGPWTEEQRERLQKRRPELRLFYRKWSAGGGNR